MNHLYILTVFSLLINCSNDKIVSSEFYENTNTLKSEIIIIEQEIDNQLVNRPVIIKTLEEVDTLKKYPVVIAFHGRGGSNSSWVNILKEFTDSGDFIGVYPQGYLKSWNLGTEPSNADDVDFIKNIIRELYNYDNIDTTRIFAIGASNGAGMVNLLGSKTSYFKGLAPIASQLITSIDVVNQTDPVSVLQINGALDNTVPINGGTRFGHTFLDAYQSVLTWATQFECNIEPKISENELTIRYQFSECLDEITIEYLRIENAGHNIAENYPRVWQEIWEFFNEL
jgi:poly(3-hydroxybutyrate) depolymerase